MSVFVGMIAHLLWLTVSLCLFLLAGLLVMLNSKYIKYVPLFLLFVWLSYITVAAGTSGF